MAAASKGHPPPSGAENNENKCWLIAKSYCTRHFLFEYPHSFGPGKNNWLLTVTVRWKNVVVGKSILILQ